MTGHRALQWALVASVWLGVLLTLVLALILNQVDDDLWGLVYGWGGIVTAVFLGVGCVHRGWVLVPLVPAAALSALMGWSILSPDEGINLTPLFFPPVIAGLGAIGGLLLAARSRQQE